MMQAKNCMYIRVKFVKDHV